MRRIRRIDRGGFGFVDEMKLDDGTRVARKSFDPQGPNDAERDHLRRRFEREVRIQSALGHPNIMPVLESRMDADPPWFTMPLASCSLEEKIRDDHRQGRALDTEPWPDILSAVEELHRLGYVHRDLKPANILLVDNTWMISDFGLILPTMRDTTVLTRSGAAYGSHYYAAPEQAVDFRHTPDQADIFALGCILHDALADRPARIPFAQIRFEGAYGPLLEKCTEVEYTRRFPTVASLRAALFDLWRTAAAPAPSAEDEDILAAVVADCSSPELWRRLLQRLEGLAAHDRGPILRGINSELIVALHGLDAMLFSRLVILLCGWASGHAFAFSYCDVVGDRLLEAYRLASVRLRCEIVLATLELAVSHNRWHVMQQAGGMLRTAADNGLVDRVLIEMGLEHSLERKLRRIEEVINWPRRNWHERVATWLTERNRVDE